MRKTLQLVTLIGVLGFAAPLVATAEPIMITAGSITLPGLFDPVPTTLTGTDGVRTFTFNGFISSDSAIDAYGCSPCLSQIGIGIMSASAASGSVTYGNESYQTAGGFLDTQGERPSMCSVALSSCPHRALLARL